VYFLRELRVSDGAALFPSLSDEDNHKYTTPVRHENEEQTMRWIERLLEDQFWVIALPDDRAIGLVGYRKIDNREKKCMLSIHLSKSFWGKGIMPKAVILTDDCMLSHTNIVKIAATVKPENLQSQRCLLKAGYELERVITDYVSTATNDDSRVRHYYSKGQVSSYRQS